MSKLTRDQVLKLAHLSRLKLTEAEINNLTEELSKILNYVEKLNSTDVSGLEPTYQVTGLKNVMRQDEVVDYQAQPSDLLAQAPAVQDKQFKVKRILE